MKTFFTLILCSIVFITKAQWSNTANDFYDSLHMPVCTSTGVQQHPVIVKSYPDSGYFVIWEDDRNTAVTKKDIYAQKYDKNGNMLWAPNGVPVVNGPNEQHFYSPSNEDYRFRPYAATDSAGGFYIAYTDDSIATYYWGRICVQHMKSDGNAVFPGAGYIIAQTAGGESYNFSAPYLIADDKGGFYISYSKNTNENYIYIYCYKDINGTMAYYGGGCVNQNALELQQAEPCVGAYRRYVYYPGTTVSDYTIWPDLQGNCNVIISMNGNTGQQGKMLCYNKVWKAKKNAHVTYGTVFPTGNPDTQVTDYTKGDVDILYKLRILLLDGHCASSTGNYFWGDEVLISNGYLLIDQGGYDYNYPKGVTVKTAGNINITMMASTTRSLTGSGVTPFIIPGIGFSDEIYDSIPYQRASYNDPFFGYNTTVPSQVNKANYFRDTLLSSGNYYPDFSLAGGGNQIYAAALLDEPGQSFSKRAVRLQHLAVERQTADSFAILFKTSSNHGEIIGREVSTGFGGTDISYDIPLITANSTGNALFYIREYGRYTRVSPIGSGAELTWGAMGVPIGTPIAYGGYYYPEFPFVALDPANGTGLVTWQDTRNFPVNTGTNIFMRHLDSLNVVDYLPLNKKVQPLANGSTFANPAYFTGTSKKYSTMEAYNNLTGTTSPVIGILDNYALGAISANIYEHTGAIRIYNSKPYLNRNYTIKPENNPAGAANINVRLFFTTAEFDALKAADPSIVSLSDLGVIKQSNAGTNVPSAYAPVAGEEMLSPIASKTIAGGHYIEVAVTGFSNFFILKGTGALPVTWLNIQAQWSGNSQANVSWQVSQEQHAKEYIVQTSTDGVTYTNACTVAARNVAQYNCVVPAGNNVKYYYRILQVDEDGRNNLSKVVVLQKRTGNTSSLVLSPNPASHTAVLNYTTGDESITGLVLINSNGAVLWKRSVLLNGSGAFIVPVQQLAAGIYGLQVQRSNGTQTIKLMKQ